MFLADIKGDIAGMSQAATSPPGDKLHRRLVKLGIDKSWQPAAYPVVFRDLHGKLGWRVRVTLSKMGPMLLARVLESIDPQQGVLHFRVVHVAL